MNDLSALKLQYSVNQMHVYNFLMKHGVYLVQLFDMCYECAVSRNKVITKKQNKNLL